jgi:putative FmdB family regulatory protein
LPNYGYRCQACASEFEVLQRMSDPAQAACPACGGAGTRLFFPTGILFKGSGFYKTDSRPTAATASTPGTETVKPGTDNAKPGTDNAKPGTDTTTPAKQPSKPSAPAASGDSVTAPAPTKTD